MDNMDGDSLGIVLQYTNLSEAIRLLKGIYHRLSYKKLKQVLSKGALQQLMTRMSNWLLFCPALENVGALTPCAANFNIIWMKGSSNIPRRCENCYSVVRWKNPGWTSDAKLICWWHYQKIHHRDIKTTTELANMCKSKTIPRGVKRKYQDLQLKIKRTSIGASLYYIPPIRKAIKDYVQDQYMLM